MQEKNGDVKTKICTKCKQEKELNSKNFPPHNKTKSGFDSWCRNCRSIYRSSVCRGRFRKCISDENLKLLKENTKVCMICKKEPIEVKCGNTVIKKLFGDHCHKTNKFRGLLCYNCNWGLGKFHDSIEILQNAIKYLENK